MTKRDYEAAARIAQDMRRADDLPTWEAVCDAFVQLFRADSAAFNEARFRRACVPGRNVRART